MMQSDTTAVSIAAVFLQKELLYVIAIRGQETLH